MSANGSAYRSSLRSSATAITAADPSRLAPEDAFFSSSSSPPRRMRQHSPLGLGASAGNSPAVRDSRLAEPASAALRRKLAAEKAERKRSRSGRRANKARTWRKLLWVHQSFPDNYTDEETFLDHLQRNPRLRPYEFWPLMADTTVIVQHVCSVAIFVCCFVGIIQERVSPITVVGCGSLSTVLGWALWDVWEGQQLLKEAKKADGGVSTGSTEDLASISSGGSSSVRGSKEPQGLALLLPNGANGGGAIPPVSRMPRHKHTMSTASNGSSVASTSGSAAASTTTAATTGHPTGAPSFASYSTYPPYGGGGESGPTARNQQRLATAKSAVLIYCALLGLSPILRSLTKSTTSDSIWAMSCWLMCINVFFFDYSGGVGAKFPASLSTNAALMASTVLASRLPTTTHVFSLTLFSIEVFGLFPVFRRCLRPVSWRGHMLLTAALVFGAGGGVGATISGGGWRAAAAGTVLGALLTCLAMGICCWWLIGLQKYKNEIHGPWDPARPIVRRRWD